MFILLSLWFITLHAQQNFTGTGGNASGSAGSSSYSVGQLVYTTNTGSNGSVVQGVQQPYEISVSGIDKAKGIDLICSTFPNPANDVLTLVVKNTEIKGLYYQLYDINGKLILNNKVDATEIQIPMKDFIAGIYFLKLYYQNEEVKTFKIIKN